MTQCSLLGGHQYFEGTYCILSSGESGQVYRRCEKEWVTEDMSGHSEPGMGRRPLMNILTENLGPRNLIDFPIYHLESPRASGIAHD
jgi:hypothetical protein